jgi:hypothetical protein
MRLIVAITFLVLVLGCINAKECRDPYILVGADCCLDENRNSICDDQEMQNLVLVVNASGLNESVKTPRHSTTTSTGTTLDYVKTTLSEPELAEPPKQRNDSIQRPNPGAPVFCTKSSILLSNTAEDAYVGDMDERLDGLGDGVWENGYDMVGDMPGRTNTSDDSRFKTVLAFPLAGMGGNISEASVYVTPYLTQGDASETYIEHVFCGGGVQLEDYSSASDGNASVIIKASDVDDVIYGADVTKYLQDDINKGREFSCYRLYWNVTSLDQRNNGEVDRRVLYGFDSEYAPYLSYIQLPCIRCRVNGDCDDENNVGGYKCIDNNRKIVKQTAHYRCESPSTEAAKCITSQDSVTVDGCKSGYMCVDSENQCFEEHCYGGVNETTQEDVVNGAVCGGPCRPCHCFDGYKDESEVEIDCGGDCRPCPPNERLPTVQIISPNDGATYGMENIYLRYLTKKYNVNCFFSLNGGRNSTLSGDRYIKPFQGINDLIVYCNDSYGVLGVDEVRFNIEAVDNICPSDGLHQSYPSTFDRVDFLMKQSTELGPTNSCDEANFRLITTGGDSSALNLGPFDQTYAMRDRLAGDYRHSMLSYICSGQDGYELWMAHARKTMPGGNVTSLWASIYFVEVSSPTPNEEVLVNNWGAGFNVTAGVVYNLSTNDLVVLGGQDYVMTKYSYWRIYPYDGNGDVVNGERYMDILYDPVNSTCGGDTELIYQELNLTGLILGREFAENETLGLRFTLYSKDQRASLGLVEAAVAAE